MSTGIEVQGSLRSSDAEPIRSGGDAEAEVETECDALTKFLHLITPGFPLWIYKTEINANLKEFVQNSRHHEDLSVYYEAAVEKYSNYLESICIPQEEAEIAIERKLRHSNLDNASTGASSGEGIIDGYSLYGIHGKLEMYAERAKERGENGYSNAFTYREILYLHVAKFIRLYSISGRWMQFIQILLPFTYKKFQKAEYDKYRYVALYFALEEAILDYTRDISYDRYTIFLRILDEGMDFIEYNRYIMNRGVLRSYFENVLFGEMKKQDAQILLDEIENPRK